MQRTEHFEAAYRETFGKGLVEAGVYADSISDAAISALTPVGHYADGNVLPDLFSRSSTLNGGRYHVSGYRVSYARTMPLLSGFLHGGDLIAGKGAIVEVGYGEGRVILLGFRTQHRGQPHGTFRFLFNAILRHGLEEDS